MQDKKLDFNELAEVDVLMREIKLLNEWIEESTDPIVTEELKQELTALVVRVNTIYGTDHIIEGSKITEIR